MLIHNYVAMADQTIKRIGNNKTVARTKKWDWNKKHSKSSKCIVRAYPESNGVKPV